MRFWNAGYVIVYLYGIAMVSNVLTGCVSYRDNTIMTFYGKLVDQYNSPVSGADILGSV
jgi:hypothetical protein